MSAGSLDREHDRRGHAPDSAPLFADAALLGFAESLLLKAGMEADKAACVAELLLDGDRMGHSTHGLQLLAGYLAEIEKGNMKTSGQPIVLADRPAALTWNGQYLPGLWLLREAIREGVSRARVHGTCTVVIRQSHHIGCLAVYPPLAAAEGMMLLLASSDPMGSSVAPHGALAGRFTPNPIAAGWPTDGLPVVMDISASTTSNGMTSRLHRLNQADGGQRRLGGQWLVDNQGNATDDPAAFFTKPPGAILPLGGMDLGHKGYALGLMVEALTSGLGGYGHADKPGHWGANVFLQIIDPEAFGGRDAFIRETGFIAEACRTAPVKPGNPPVRLPGERGLKLKAEQMQAGIRLHPEIMPSLVPWAEKFGIALPAAI
ncbi:Ldh family oxidoreductase [Ferrovibrio sp.]|uniref:Ldh family oxidoreductase n=1 Tax=Ferrovibrio sp. TaxID=1917215 RepID=UPI003D0A41FF